MSKYEEMGLTPETKRIIKEQLSKPKEHTYLVDAEIVDRIEALKKMIKGH